MEATLSNLLCYLVSGRGNNFYARILTALELRETRAVPAMAVTVKDRKFILFHNPDWFKEAPYDKVLAVIEHEVCHLIWEHVPRSIEMIVAATTPERKQEVNSALPFACDMAVNTILEKTNVFMYKHRKEFVLPDCPENGFNFPKGKAMEWYAEAIIRQMRKQPKMYVDLNQILQEAISELEEENEDGEGEEGEGEGEDGEDGEEGQGQQGKSKKPGSGKQPGKGKGAQKGKGRGKGQGSGKGEGEGEGKGEGEGRGKSSKKSSQGKSGGKGQKKGSGQGGGGDEEGNEGDEGDEGQGKKNSRGIGFDLLANHKHWQGDTKKDVSIEDKLSLADELRNKLKSIVSKALEDHIKSRCTVPAELQERINKLMEEAHIPFTRILRNWVVMTQKYRRKRSITRMNRRHIGVPDFCPFPGTSKQRKFTVVWCIDTSGSMGSAELELGLNELRGLQKADPEIQVHVIEADSCVEHEYLLDRPETKINYEVHGRGGTSFDPALLRAQQLRADIVFYFTDGYAPAPQVGSRVSCPFAWILTPYSNNPDPTWGHVIETKYI